MANRPSPERLALRFATRNGRAKAGKDSRNRSGRVAFPAGVTRRVVRVKTINDKVKERSEVFFLRIWDPDDRPLGRARALIRDND